jgi:hypothetical protein
MTGPGLGMSSELGALYINVVPSMAGQAAAAAAGGREFGEVFSKAAADQIKTQLPNYMRDLGSNAATSFGSGLGPIAAQMLTHFMPSAGPVIRHFSNMGKQAADVFWLDAARQAEVGSKQFQDITLQMGGKMLEGWKTFSAESANAVKAGAKEMAAPYKAGMALVAAAGTEIFLSDVRNMMKLAGTEVAAFGKVGKDAADTMMGSFVNVVHGKSPDVMAAFNVIEEGFKAIWEAPQNIFNTFLDNTVGHIPVIGSSIKGVVSEAEGALNAVFPLFDEFKELAGQFLGVMVDIGTQWQEIARTIAGQTLGTEQLTEYLGVVREIASSGLVLNFQDVAQVVGELGQRLSGLDNNVGVTRDQLRELATTVAEGNELLGNIHINIDALTAAFNQFGVPASKTNELLTEFINISRLTGASINDVLHDVEGAGPAFQDMGFSIEDTYFLMAKFNQELGSPAMNRFILSMRGMPEAFSKLHIDPEEGYKELVKKVRDFVTSGDIEDALNTASRFMSKSAASTFIAGIKMGFLGTPEEIAQQVEKAARGVDGIRQPLERVLEATKSIKDELGIISTQFVGMFAPLVEGLAGALRDAGDSVSSWIKTHQSQIIGWATETMDRILSTASVILRTMSGLLEELAPIIGKATQMMAFNVLAVTVAVKTLVDVLDALPTSMHMGINTEALKNDLDGVIGPMKDLMALPITQTLANIGNAGIGLSDQLDQRVIPSLDRFGHSAAEAAKFASASTGTFTAPGDHEAKSQNMVSLQEKETLSGSVDDLGKVAEKLKDIKGIQVLDGGKTLIGDPADIRLAMEALKDVPVVGSQPETVAMKLLGDPSDPGIQDQWKHIQSQFSALGVQITYDTKTGVISGVTAGTDAERGKFEDWWKEETGQLPPVAVQIVPTVSAAPGSPGATPDYNLGPIFPPGHAFGGPIPSDGWIRGSWKQGQDSVPHDLPLGGYVIRREAAQRNAGLLDRLHQGRAGAAPFGTTPAMLEVGERFMPPGGPMDLYNAINYGGYDEGGEVDHTKSLMTGFFKGFLGSLGIKLPGKERGSGSGSVRFAAAYSPSDTGTSTPGNAPAAHAGPVRDQAYQAMIDAGFTAADWPALDYIISHESSWDPTSINKTDINWQHGDPSRGLGQLILSHYKAYGIDPYTNDPYLQVKAQMRYIKETYGTLQNAYQHWLTHRNYQTGGGVGLAEGGHSGWFGGAERRAPMEPTNANISKHFAHAFSGGGCTDPNCTDPSHFHVGGGVPGFAGGGPAFTQVIWAGNEAGEETGMDSGRWVGTPGSSDPGFYHRPEPAYPGGAMEAHHGHVHTTAYASPFDGTPYGLPSGTDIRQGGTWPHPFEWVNQLGSQYKLRPSTYSGHSVGKDGLQHGIDWYPLDKANDAGTGYGHADNVTLTTFAQSVGQSATGTAPPGGAAPGVQTVGWGGQGSLPQSPGGTGGPSGPSGSGEPAPQPEGGGGTGTGTGPGGPYPPGISGLPSGFSGLNPYTNLPSGMQTNTREYQEWRHKFDEWMIRIGDQSSNMTDATSKAASADDEVNNAKREERDAYKKYTDKLPTLLPGENPFDAEEWKKEEAAVTRLQQAIDRQTEAHKNVTKLQQRQFTDSENPPPEPSGSGGHGKDQYESIGQELGGGFMKGFGQAMGFGDVFGKPPWEWGTWKLFAGGAGYGLNLLNLMGDKRGQGLAPGQQPGQQPPAGPPDAGGTDQPNQPATPAIPPIPIPKPPSIKWPGGRGEVPQADPNAPPHPGMVKNPQGGWVPGKLDEHGHPILPPVPKPSGSVNIPAGPTPDLPLGPAGPGTPGFGGGGLSAPFAGGNTPDFFGAGSGDDSSGGGFGGGGGGGGGGMLHQISTQLPHMLMQLQHGMAPGGLGGMPGHMSSAQPQPAGDSNRAVGGPGITQNFDQRGAWTPTPSSVATVQSIAAGGSAPGSPGGSSGYAPSMTNNAIN